MSANIKDGEKLSFADFKKLTKKNCSTIFLCIFFLIRKICLVYRQFNNHLIQRKKPKLVTPGTPNPKPTKILPSPIIKEKTKLSPLVGFQNSRPFSKFADCKNNGNGYIGSLLEVLSGKKKKKKKKKKPHTKKNTDSPTNHPKQTNAYPSKKNTKETS
eukprot:TRINITY_DN6727_c0_g1_i3.p1 TRINITY_DN6727_c0_g1~~TRINITY_DN6727_c0_g1_i3.p1  ORF type:complete len:158 (+),score=27.75 TRINITY_DN6727_c0_g1_i3:175-648(+)